jgi:DNA-binding NarL/FixJ family response regulator
MPKKDGLEGITELMSRPTDPRTIVLTSSEKATDLRRSLATGTRGYLVKGAEVHDGWNAVREVAAGRSSLPRNVAAKLADSMAQPELSQRELEVLQQMAVGKSNKEIGRALYISEHTVKNHVKTILKKLNAGSRTEATAVASERGLVKIG